MQSPVLERVLRVVPRLLVLTAPAGYLKTTTAFAYAQVFKTHAAVDLHSAKNARDLLLALVQTLEPAAGADAYLRQAQLSLAADEDVPAALADRVLDAWREPGAPAAVVFDNAEQLAPELLPLFREILERRPAYRTCIVCTAIPLESPAPDADTLCIDADELAFSEEQTRALFADTDCGAGQLGRIAECAQGRPLLTLLLRYLYPAGRLDDVLSQAARDADPARRYAFVQERAIASLTPAQRRVLEFCACVADARDADVRTALGSPAADDLGNLPASFPLLWRHDDRLEVHSLLREELVPASRYAHDDLRAAARSALRRGDPVTAAQRYLACADRDEALKVFDGMLERGATADVARLAALLDRDALRGHARWFALMTFLRRYDLPPQKNLAATQAERAYVERTGDEMARLTIGIIETHQLLHGGLLESAQERLNDLDEIVVQLKRGGIVNALRAHLAARFIDTLRAALLLARGEAAQAERLLKRVRFMLGQFPMISVSTVIDGWLLIGLLRADLHLVRLQCARARESLTRTGMDIVLVDLDVNEAFAGWLLGDDATYREALSRLDVRARTYRSRAFDHALGCMGITPECEPSGLEPLRRLIIAHLFAAGRMKDERGLAHAQRALHAARELRHALFTTLAAIAVRERGADPALRPDEIVALSAQTEASYVSRLR